MRDAGERGFCGAGHSTDIIRTVCELGLSCREVTRQRSLVGPGLLTADSAFRHSLLQGATLVGVRVTAPPLPAVTDLMDKTWSKTDKMAPVVDSSEDSSSQEHERSDTESETDTEWEQDPASSQSTDFSAMSFEEIIRVKDKMGTKAFYKVVQGSRAGTLSADSMKADKSRPLEMSSKKPVPFLRKVVPARKRMQRDPRFDDLSGEFKPEIFEKTYGFLENIKKKEKETLEKKLQKTRDPALREQLTKLLLRMDQQEKAAKQKQRLREKEAEFKRQQRERAQQGKKPLYLKKSDIRKLQLVDKYQELKKKGKVENFLSKKRKRNSIKDRKRLPSQQ